jgi:hypothetical protein
MSSHIRASSNRRFSNFDHSSIVAYLRPLIDEHGNDIISRKGLESIGHLDLAECIRCKSTFRQVKADLGIELPPVVKSRDELISKFKVLFDTYGQQSLSHTWLSAHFPHLVYPLVKFGVRINDLKAEFNVDIPHTFPKGFLNDKQNVLDLINQYLQESGKSDFLVNDLKTRFGNCMGKAITNLGGVRAVKSMLSINVPKIPSDFTTIEEVDEEIFRFISLHGEASFSSLNIQKNMRGYGYLLSAMNDFGGISVFRDRLNLSNNYVARGHWDDFDNVINACQEFISTHGTSRFTQSGLTETGNRGLHHAINKHGGMNAIRKQLDIKLLKRDNGFWNQASVLSESKTILAEHGELAFTRAWFDQHNRHDLYNAIRKHSGGLVELRIQLGLNPDPFSSVSLQTRRALALTELKHLITNLKLEIDSHGSTGLSISQMILIVRQGFGVALKKEINSLSKEEGGDILQGMECGELTPQSMVAWAHSGDPEPTFNKHHDPEQVETTECFHSDPIKVDSSEEGDSGFNNDDLVGLTESNLPQPVQIDNQFKLLENLTFVTDDCEAVEFLKRETKRELWNSAYSGDEGLQYVINKCKTVETSKPWTISVCTEMLETLQKIQDLQLPTEFNYTVKGSLVTPTIMQKHVAIESSKVQELLIMSEMGTGKSLAAQLALTSNGCKNIIVIAMNQCVSQWVNDFQNQWNGLNVHQLTLEELNDTRFAGTFKEDQRNIVVVPSHFFSYMDDEQVEWLTALADFDGVILDEIHVFKSRDQGESNRKRQVTKFLTLIKQGNPERYVLGMSGTVIVNCISEAISLIELTTCESRADLSTGRGLEQEQRVHQALMTIGIRQRSLGVDIPIQLHEPKVDLSHLSEEIKAVLQTDPVGRITKYERLFLPSTLPTIIASINGPTIIATQYVNGFVGPISRALEANGFTYGINTGESKEPCRDYLNAVEAFKAGAIDVLIGSIETICTGIDGFQDVCSNMVIASLPWTAANYQQLIKRLARTGQTQSKVKVTIPRLFFEFFEDDSWKVWSYSDYRKSVITKKQRIMDAVIDGTIASNVVEKLTEALVTEGMSKMFERICQSENIFELTSHPLQVPLTFQSPTEELKARRRFGDFSRINGRWNSSSSSSLHQRLLADPQEWEMYHTELESLRSGWSVDPLSEVIKYLAQSQGLTVGDFGCGTGQLAEALNGRHTVHSFDHVAYNDSVVACDVAEGVDLPDRCLDVAVFCLSLMGSNWKQQLVEARRCLSDVGQIIVWNAASAAVSSQVEKALEDCGFKVFESQAHDKWLYVRAAAAVPAFAPHH